MKIMKDLDNKEYNNIMIKLNNNNNNKNNKNNNKKMKI